MTTLTFTVPKALWLTSNRHITNRGYRQRIIGALHDLAIVNARAAKMQQYRGPVLAAWEIRYPKGVRTDKGEASNAQPTTKALLDGLVKAGVLIDDGPAWVTGEHFRRGPNLDRASDHEVVLTLRIIDQEVPF